MTRVIGIDYGKKRVGLAVSDPLRITARPLTALHPDELVEYLKNYILEEEVSHIVVGMPSTDNEILSDFQNSILNLKKDLENNFPDQRIVLQDERYSSQDAMNFMIATGVKKKKRKEKEYLDQMSAVIILRRYLQLDI